MLLVNNLIGFGVGGAGITTPTTWNPSDKSSQITLSGGDLTSEIGTSGIGGVRSVVGKSSGKWYWEATIAGTGPWFVGIARSDDSMTTYTSAGVGYYSDGRTFDNDRGYAAYGPSYTAGDVLGFLLDMDAGTFKVYKNNADPGGTARSSLSGTFYAYRAQLSDGTGHPMTHNFGASAFTYTPPAGYTAGLGT